MLDTVLNIVCAFDWLTPTATFVQDYFNGPTNHFGIPAQAGWIARDIKRILKRRGVHVWGLMYNVSGDMLMFSVRKAQAKRAYDILQQEGVPILYAPREVSASSRNSEVEYSPQSGFKFELDDSPKKRRSYSSSQKVKSSNNNASWFPKGFFGGPLD